MAHFRAISYALPIAPALLQSGPNFNVKVCTHDASFAKLCAYCKQYFAHDF